MKFAFSLSQTPDSRKTLRIPKELKAELKLAAKLTAQGEIPGLTEFVFGTVGMSDEELLKLNISSLGHDWYTDIITFEIEREVDTNGVNASCDPSLRLEAEVYLSLERAQENAKKAKISVERELVHLVIHGVLHLAGYDDHDPVEKKRMVRRERFWLAQVQKAREGKPG